MGKFIEEYVKVKFLSDWMGHPEGSTLTIMKVKANELRARNIIEDFDIKPKELKVPDKVKVPKQEIKAFDSPPMNKMIDSPQIKKSSGRPKKK